MRARLAMLNECGTHLSMCLKQAPSLVESKPTPDNKLKIAKYLTKLHMQYCAILSQLNNHKEALEHAKYSAKYIHLTLCELSNLLEDFARKRNASILESTSKTILPILKALLSKLIPEDKANTTEKPKQTVNIKNLFGFFSCEETIMGLNIGNIMQLSPLTVMDSLSECERQFELTRESLLEKIAMLAISYFCISTEKRFLAQMAGIGTKDSEFFHGRALEIACQFLPSECPLVSHVYATYQKHYSAVQRPIVVQVLMASLKMAKSLKK
eukprot:TRINITY_DN4504_c0_g1_i8.p1 TRINITY_DN4504_c0_g1~~TRINITY_DN4504_c0_g1_i8.p1  ORF type:complete len:269 (-),score=36.30 TRINITY_DN4504_c0_g1_i8:868-1674(-)